MGRTLQMFMLLQTMRSFGCNSDMDCSMNGLCNDGNCDCDAGWTRKGCSQLNYASQDPRGTGLWGLTLPPSLNITTVPFHPELNTSSWGGAVVRGDDVYLPPGQSAHVALLAFSP